MHTSPFPVCPFLQEQLWEPLVLVQFAFISQTWLPLLHSSISAKMSKFFSESEVIKAMFILKVTLMLSGLFNVPEHSCPFPAYPSLQEQLWEPLVLVQFAFTSQTWLPLMHSSISAKEQVIPESEVTKAMFILKVTLMLGLF